MLDQDFGDQEFQFEDNNSRQSDDDSRHSRNSDNNHRGPQANNGRWGDDDPQQVVPMELYENAIRELNEERLRNRNERGRRNADNDGRNRQRDNFSDISSIRDNVSDEIEDRAGRDGANRRERNPRRPRSPSSGARTDRSDDTRGDLETSLLAMDDMLSPRNAHLGRGRNDDNQGSRLLTARSIRAEFNRSTAKRVKKSNENFISAGPPMLQESPTNKEFYKWQGALKIYVSKLPGYIEGMLVSRPDYNSMTGREQESLREIYVNIHDWLQKSVSANTKATNKTKTLSMRPYPDLVGWWKAVNGIFALTKNQLDKLRGELKKLHQFKNESCVSYSSRFEEKVAILKDMNVDLDDHRLGVTMFRGLSKENKRTLLLLMKFETLTVDMPTVVGLCRWLDETDEQVEQEPVREEVPLRANAATILNGTQGRVSHYGPGFNDDLNSNRSNGAVTNPLRGYGNRGRGFAIRGKGRIAERGRGNYRGGNNHSNGRQDIQALRRSNAPNAVQVNDQAALQNNNFVVPMPNNPHPPLTYQIQSDGWHGWFMNGAPIKPLTAPGVAIAAGNQPRSILQGQGRDVAQANGIMGPHLAANAATLEFINEIIDHSVYLHSLYICFYSLYEIALAAYYLKTWWNNSFYSTDLLGTFNAIRNSMNLDEENRKSREYFNSISVSLHPVSIICCPVITN